MSSTAVTRSPGRAPSGPPRVREQARDAMLLMSFSAGTSMVLAVGLLLLTRLGR